MHVLYAKEDALKAEELAAWAAQDAKDAPAKRARLQEMLLEDQGKKVHDDKMRQLRFAEEEPRRKSRAYWALPNEERDKKDEETRAARGLWQRRQDLDQEKAEALATAQKCLDEEPELEPDKKRHHFESFAALKLDLYNRPKSEVK